MELIKKENVNVFVWLDKIPAHVWSRQAFDPRVKLDHITNIMNESFSQWVQPLRGKPFLTSVESLAVKMMGVTLMLARSMPYLTWWLQMVPIRACTLAESFAMLYIRPWAESHPLP